MKATIAQVYNDKIIVDKGKIDKVERGQTVKVGIAAQVRGDDYPNAIFKIVEVNMHSCVAEFIYAYVRAEIANGDSCEIVGEKWGLVD